MRNLPTSDDDKFASYANKVRFSFQRGVLFFRFLLDLNIIRRTGSRSSSADFPAELFRSSQ